MARKTVPVAGHFGLFARRYEHGLGRGASACSPGAVRSPRCRAGSAGCGRVRSWAAAPAGEDVAGEPELVDGGLVDLLAVGGRLGAQYARVAGLEADDAQEFGDVDVLGGEAAAQDVVGVGHDLDAEAVQVGVRDAGAEEQGLAGLQSDVVEEHGGDDAGVARVVVGDVGVRRRSGAAEPGAGAPRPR